MGRGVNHAYKAQSTQPTLRFLPHQNTDTKLIRFWWKSCEDQFFLMQRVYFVVLPKSNQNGYISLSSIVVFSLYQNLCFRHSTFIYNFISCHILIFVAICKTNLFCLVSSFLAIEMYQIVAARRAAHHLFGTVTISSMGTPTKDYPNVSRILSCG